MKHYRTIYNQDCTDLFCTTIDPLTPEHVDRMVDEVAEGGTDVFLVNPNAQRVNYPSKVWQTFWDGYAPGDPAFFGNVAPEEIGIRGLWVAQMKRLADQGCNYLARSLARCRERRIAPGISVRMNDMHDAPRPGTHLYSKFYMDYPELHLSNDVFCSWGATGFNYEHPAVRNHFLSLLRELTRDYDFDVLELDFMRFHGYFPRENFDDHCAIMTEFVREVRSIADQAGRKIDLTTRVAATPAAAYELGFDVAAWSREGLVDGITASAFLGTQWRIPIAEFRGLVDEDIPIYVCMDITADQRPGLPKRDIPLEPDLLRGFAAGNLAAGAHGIEMFNFFVPREEAHVRYREQFPDDESMAGFRSVTAKWPSFEPRFDIIGQMKDLDSLRGVKKIYTLMTGWTLPETDGPVQAPVVIERGGVKSFRILLAAEPESAAVEVAVLFTGSIVVSPGQLWLQVNHVTAGAAKRIEPVREGGDIRRAIFDVPPAALRDGDNELVVRNEAGHEPAPFVTDPTPEDVAGWSQLGTVTLVSIDVTVRTGTR